MNALLSHYDLDTGKEGVRLIGVRLIKAKPAQVISDCAARQTVDLIVMGRLGRTGNPGLIIGNTAEDVLNETQTAVLAVKPGGFISPGTQ